MKKIIVGLKGGLGNQLFQFAYGKYLSLQNRCIMKLDKSLYMYYKLHKYGLEPFNIYEEFAKKTEVPRQYLTNNRILRKIHTVIDPIISNAIIIKEKTLSYDPNLLNQSRDVIYLDGYWQSERYFEPISDIIKKSLILRHEVREEPSFSILQKIKETNSVCIHIRRGSYILAKYQAIHGLTSFEYYDKAIKLMDKRVKSAEYFIFSDDTKWIMQNFKSLANSTIIVGTPENDFIDLFLMSQCKHNIIANSTFSWWGAWLNSHPDKIVVAPMNWYHNIEMNNTTKDLIPNSWIRL